MNVLEVLVLIYCLSVLTAVAVYSIGCYREGLNMDRFNLAVIFSPINWLCVLFAIFAFDKFCEGLHYDNDTGNPYPTDKDA